MDTTIKIFSFNDQEIEFDLSNNSIMINATKMAKIFNAQVNEFTSNDKTKSFISECLNNGNSRYLNVEKEEDLIISKPKTGTWMHRVLALKFAAWLSPAIELWIFIRIDELMFGKLKQISVINQERVNLQKNIAEKEAMFYETVEGFVDYMKDKQKLLSLAHQVAKYTKPEAPELDL
jgi:hypothetical protein